MKGAIRRPAAGPPQTGPPLPIAVEPGAGLRFDASPDLPAGWDSLPRAAGSPTSRAWLTLGADRLPDRMLTIGLRDASGAWPVAMTATVVRRPLRNARMDPHRILSGAAEPVGLMVGTEHPWRGLEPADVHPCCLLMSPFFDCSVSGAGRDDPALLGRLLAGVERWCRDRGVTSVSMLYVPDSERALLRAAAGRGYTCAPLAPNCTLPVRWTDFAGYLSTLPSRRRVSIRRERRSLAERGVVVVRRRLAAHEPDLARLRALLSAKYGGLGNPEREAGFLTRLRSSFPADHIEVFEARQGERTLGFSLFVRAGDVWTALLTGAESGDPAAALVYFATLFYEPVVAAAADRAAELRYGYGSWQAKTLRGCELSPTFALSRRLDRTAGR